MMRKVFAGCVALAVVPAFGVTVESTGADAAVKFAARDLERILKDVPGRIVLREEMGLRPQEWRLRTAADGSLVISGRDGMGIAYGAFTFLEDKAGVSWLAPDTEIVPDLKGWTLPQLDETGIPAFSFREQFVGTDFMDSDWRLRNKEANRASCGVGVWFGSPGDCHTFAAYSKLLKEKHPELFKDRLDASGHPCTSLCMTDPATRHYVAEEMMNFIAKDRAARAGKPPYTVPMFYDLSQDDGGSGGECMCADCKALYEREGSYSGPNLAFVNAVADEVCAKYPDVIVQTFAYSYTQKPPKTVKASSNVVVRLCNSWYLHPLAADSDNGRELVEWSRHASKIGIWSYWRTYKGTLDPCVIPHRTIRDEIRFCRDCGVIRYYAEDEAPLSRNFAMLQHWLMLKLTDNPDRDLKALMVRFMGGYYGAAAVPMGKFLKLLESTQEGTREFLNRDYFEKANAYLDEAEALVADDARSLRHVRWERVVTDRAMYTYLARLQKQGYAFDREAVAARFARNSVEQIETWPEFRPAARKQFLVKRLQRAKDEAELYGHYPVPLPAEFAGKEVEDLQWTMMSLVCCGPHAETGFVSDPDACAGKAWYNAGFEPKPPQTIGLYNSLDTSGKKNSPLTFMPPDDPKAKEPGCAAIPQDEKFHLYRIDRRIMQVPLYIHFDSKWTFRHWFGTVGIVPEERDVWVSVKFTGPDFVKGSTQPNRMLFDRILLVK